ncbi:MULTISPECIES: ABC transporter ATP-binding protein [unclassified Acidovorax]|uniref:ABC transporter ATP-binding protein n=1 Tax=unclassified Acidovorax TaxID=2684926 RepID=UPI0028830983|nr:MULTISPECIES: ABC transporter ATP-binding protein [unclassified Acidovorax]
MTAFTDTPLLQVSDLTVRLPTPSGMATAVRQASFTLKRGETLGIVGESGSGKSLTALALMGLLPEGATTTGSVRFAGQELMGAPDAQLCQLRGNRIGMVFQEPMTALNPVHTIGRQVAEPLRLHRGLSARAARAEAIGLLERVGIAQAAQRIDAYPHQFSGGQRQRITIAMALACGPDLLIADEPTTALDVTLQQQILDLIADLVAERGMALILISHDLGVISQNVDRLLVMYGGSIVESGSTAAVFDHRAHPYTRGLFAARPQLLPTAGRRARLPTIAGTVPALADLPPGCPFAGRCAFTIADCHAGLPAALRVSAGSAEGVDHRARCIRLGDVAASQEGAHEAA